MTARILYLGKEKEHFALIARLLREGGYDVQAGPGLNTALRVAGESAVDLVIVEANGASTPSRAARSGASAVSSDATEDLEPLIAQLRSLKDYSRIPIVAIVGEASRDRLLAIGCNGLLSPPLNPATLMRELTRYLKGRRERVRVGVRSRELEAFGREMLERLQFKVDELTASNARLIRSDEIRRRILVNVSRELAGPLTPLVANLALLEGGQLGPISPRQKRVLDAVDRDLQRLAGTVSRVLDLASIEEGRRAPELGVTELAGLVRATRKGLAAKARSRRVQIELAVPKKEVLVWTDPKLVAAMLLHALDHALAFSPRGGVCLIELELREARAYCRVYDQGEALDPGENGNLFEAFTGAGRRDGDGHPALALGLVLSQRLARGLGVELQVTSPPLHHPNSDHSFSGLCLEFMFPKKPEEDAHKAP